MSQSKFCLGIVLVATVLAMPAACWAQTADEIEEARLLGLKYIQSEQQEDGSWIYEGHSVGITALCALALIENGVPVSDLTIERAHRYVVRNHDEQRNTYDLALSILLIDRIGDREDRDAVRTLACRLICGQNTEGGWSYTNPKVPSSLLTNKNDRPDPPEGTGDNSCTQFAVLGLWVASRWGVDIEETMVNVDQRFTDTQEEDGGWPYNHGVEEAASGSSMTFAGLFCLTVARATELREEQARTQSAGNAGNDDSSEGDSLITDPVFSHGLERAGQFAGGIGNGSPRYFLWSVERLGVLLGLEQFGTTDWFTRGAAALIATQGEDGSWEHGTWGKLSDTSFAILFLRRANLGSDISRLLEGEPDEAFQIISQEEEPRFRTLVEALAAAADGDVIHVEGDGPFEMPHIDLDQSVRIVAGAGYEPVFIYEIGYDADGRRSRPEEDREARHMIRTRAGTLEMEGLLLQFDPPNLGRAITDWSTIRVEGGNLRLLNCRISESNGAGAAGIYITQPGEVFLRNCICVGGRAAVEILTTGLHQVTIENSIVFATHAFHVFNGAAGTDAKLELTLQRCAIHGEEIFFFPRLTNPVDIVCNGCALKAQFLGSQMLREPNGHEGLTWTGSNNLYEVTQWVGAARTINTRVTDAASWSRFWGGTDADGLERIISFSGRRNLGGFTHGIRGQDFEFPSDSNIYAYRRRLGIEPLITGPGEGYARYRESFDYRTWEDPDLEVAAAE